MSWSRDYANATAFERDEPIPGFNPNVFQTSPRVKEQFEAARNAATLILKSRAVGHEGQNIAVRIGGSVSPDHEATSGRYDSVTVTVTQLAPVVTSGDRSRDPLPSPRRGGLHPDFPADRSTAPAPLLSQQESERAKRVGELPDPSTIDPSTPTNPPRR